MLLKVKFSQIQWNLSIMVTLGPDISGLYIQVAYRENLHKVVSNILVAMTVINE